ncbi:MAG: DUF502 domain-containing protein [Verrucomicrobiales bacterium]|nr:DUF502 domain-containing protein [Verrucomicrobiales bacterium]
MLGKLQERDARGVVSWLRNMFLAGLAVAVPLGVTVWIIGFVAKLVIGVGDPVLGFIARMFNVVSGRKGDEALTGEDLTIPLFGDANLVEMLVPVVIVALLVALGVGVTNVIGRRVMGWVDRVLATIPLVSFIYKALRQVIDSFKSIGQQQNFKRVAYVEYPAPGCRLLGFVTGQFYDGEQEKSVTSIFLPTSPNPMTGFIVVVDDEKVINTSMTLEDATKMILSAGLVPPPSAVTAEPVVVAAEEDPVVADPVEEEVEEVVKDPLLDGLPVAEVDDDEMVEEQVEPNFIK